MKFVFALFLSAFSMVHGSDAESLQMTELVNKYRQTQNKPAFCHSNKMDRAAKIQSDWQAKTNTLTHDGPPEAPDVPQRFRSVGLTLGGGGAENVAANSDGNLSTTLSQWIASPGHNQNLLGTYKCFGFAKSKGASSYYMTQVFGNCDDCGAVASANVQPPVASNPSSSSAPMMFSNPPASQPIMSSNPPVTIPSNINNQHNMQNLWNNPVQTYPSVNYGQSIFWNNDNVSPSFYDYNSLPGFYSGSPYMQDMTHIPIMSV